MAEKENNHNVGKIEVVGGIVGCADAACIESTVLPAADSGSSPASDGPSAACHSPSLCHLLPVSLQLSCPLKASKAPKKYLKKKKKRCCKDPFQTST